MFQYLRAYIAIKSVASAIGESSLLFGGFVNLQINAYQFYNHFQQGRRDTYRHDSKLEMDTHGEDLS